jgi:6-pyruvoyltetrahydropterin/6-carboxytetrahydropterin synthase
MAETIFTYFTAQLAEYAADSARKYPIRPEVRLISVRLWETSSSWAEYSA